MTKIDKMEQALKDIKDQLDDLYEGQQAIKDMIRQLSIDTIYEEDEGFSTLNSFIDDFEDDLD